MDASSSMMRIGIVKGTRNYSLGAKRPDPAVSNQPTQGPLSVSGLHDTKLPTFENVPRPCAKCRSSSTPRLADISTPSNLIAMARHRRIRRSRNAGGTGTRLASAW